MHFIAETERGSIYITDNLNKALDWAKFFACLGSKTTIRDIDCIIGVYIPIQPTHYGNGYISAFHRKIKRSEQKRRTQNGI